MLTATPPAGKQGAGSVLKLLRTQTLKVAATGLQGQEDKEESPGQNSSPTSCSTPSDLLHLWDTWCNYAQLSRKLFLCLEKQFKNPEAQGSSRPVAFPFGIACKEAEKGHAVV